MIVAGIVASPIEFLETIKNTKMKFSVNDTSQSNVIILGFENFIRLKPSISKQRCLIFDTQERLESLQGLPIIKDKSAVNIIHKFRALKSIELTGVKNRDYITEYLDRNKEDGGFLHLYNTNLYNITQKPTREAVRILFLSLLNGSLPLINFKRDINKIMPKKGKALTAVQFLVELSETDLFKNMQECIKRAKKVKNDKDIKRLAQQYGVAAFDIRYFLSTLKST